MTDLISRESLLEFIDRNFRSYWDYQTVQEFFNIITNAPAIEQNEQQEAVAYTDGKGDFITKEMYDEYLKLGFYTECIVPLYNSPPKQIPERWLNSALVEALNCDYQSTLDSEQVKIFNTGVATLYEIIKESKSKILTSETNTEVGE